MGNNNNTNPKSTATKDCWKSKQKWGPGNWTHRTVSPYWQSTKPILWLHAHLLPYCLYLRGSGILILTKLFLIWRTKISIQYLKYTVYLSGLVSQESSNLPSAHHRLCSSPCPPSPVLYCVCRPGVWTQLGVVPGLQADKVFPGQRLTSWHKEQSASPPC